MLLTLKLCPDLDFEAKPRLSRIWIQSELLNDPMYVNIYSLELSCHLWRRTYITTIVRTRKKRSSFLRQTADALVRRCGLCPEC